MCWKVLYLLILVTHSCLPLTEDVTKVFCPQKQKAFRGSFYEFVGLQRSFFSAQAWCEQTGGHLAFISDEDTQYFVQRHLDPEKDVWFGVAPSASTDLQYSPTAEGPLSWLDGSRITYSNWVSSPQQGAACGHILRDSGFKWEAVKDCNKRLHFICQFESGSTIVCAGRNTTLQCGSGQVLRIDGGFYGRRNIHYCRSTLSPPITSKHQCDWVDVVQSLSAHCHGRQVCQVAEVINSFGEPCPHLGSYLSVDYQCKDGLTLTVSTVAAVFNDINISIKWLLDLSWGMISCKLRTGDGHVIYLDTEELENSVVHKYTHPSAFVVAVECTSNDRHITVQKEITIQEPVTQIGVRCYAGNLFFHASNCNALYGELFQIQMEVKSGTNVTYRIQRGKLLSSLSVVKGNVPHNVTVSHEMVKHLGPGCHQLILSASNLVTFPEVSTDLQVCVLEEVVGLQASMLTERNDCVDSPDITVGVFLEQGAPVLLLFSLRGEKNSSFSETREMNMRKEIFHIGHQIQGTVQVKLRAWNVFSFLEVDMISSCGKDSAINPDGHNGPKQLSFTKKLRNTHVRAVRSPYDITAIPSSSVFTRNTSITLSISDPSQLNNNNKQYQWSCTNPCKCQGNFNGLTYTITENCLPDPFQFNKYYFNELNKNNNNVQSSESICIILAPKPNVPNWLSLTCTQGCDPVSENTDAKFKLDCQGNAQCQNIVWNTDDPNDDNWPSETKSCYQNAQERPLILKQNGGTEFTVSQSDLNNARSKQQDITVVIYSGDVIPIYTTYTIKTSSSTNNYGPNPAVTPQSPVSTDMTTKVGSTGEKTTTARPTSTSDTSSTEGDDPYPATTIKQPVSTDMTTKSGSTGGKTTRAPPAPTSDTSSTQGDDPYPATTIKQPVSTDMTTKSGSTGGKTTPARPATTLDTISANTASSSTTSMSHTTSPATTNNINTLSCSISPSNGTVLDAFNITCQTNFPCSHCQYCFKIKKKNLRCSMNNEVKSVFLPLGDSSTNYSLVITATVKHGSDVAITSITTQVKDSTSASVNVLKASVESAVHQLKDQGLLSGETVGQLVCSVSSELNGESNESTKADRQQLRGLMLDIMTETVKEAPTSTTGQVQAMAEGLSALVQKGTELSSSSQEQASLLLVDLSSSLLYMACNKSEESEISNAVSTIVEGASNILDYSSNKNISATLLNALYNIQSALLTFKDTNEGPTIIQQANIAVFVQRVKPGRLSTGSISIPNCSCPAFSLPTLPSKLFPSVDPVDIRMLSLNKNPFSWNGRGNISGPTGALTLTTTDGSTIPVENLSNDIEILLPKPIGEQVNITMLDLRNYSTTTIDIPSADDMLLLKMVPSKDPLPFKLLLGYMAYPTETNYVAMTQMPYEGTTQEERYTWILDPKTLKGNTGIYYLVVRPIVGPGIKSINASLTITSISATCKFWNESASDWSTYGCRVGVNTTQLVTQCLCNHLTFFGSSFFVAPNLVDPSRTAELFGTFTENPVVVCFVGALFLVYFLVVVWARRKDIRDKAKVKLTILDDNDPLDEYRYLLTVSTGHRRAASTSSQVTITLLGTEGNSEPHHLTDRNKRVFEQGAVDMFLLSTPFDLGELQAIRLWHNNSGRYPAWFVGNVMVQDLQTDQKWHFLCNSWLAIDMGACTLDKVFPVSTEMDLKRFSNVFFMKATKDFSDGHLWYSVISRPPSSTFTCVQRVSCCFSLLLCTMLTSIMFYGIPTDPSEQVMELGQVEFTWQQLMIGIQSSLIMFPVNFIIVTIFRQTRPHEMSCCKRKTGKADATELASTLRSPSSQTATTNMDASVTLDSVINDITRIANSLSKNVKSNIPCQLEPGQQVDISDVLSVLEDFIRQNNKTSENTQSKTNSIIQPQIPESNHNVHPDSTVDGIQKKSNKTQYLYRQLCHIHKELSLLGPSGFPTSHSYNQALQQVQRMNCFLEDQLFTSSSVNVNELTQTRLSPADSDDSSEKKRMCCHRGLPWWFIFVGWLLVIATSFVAGYFTMLYGLKFGKQRSISWLLSMTVSFFQSVLIIQPLKVLCLAVFFALVIKKVDDEDFQNVASIRNYTQQGDFNEQQAVRQSRNLYEPPAVAAIEKMKKNKIMEQKAFAVFREILIYMLSLWMLLMVAYTQREPNAFYLNQHIINSFSGQIASCMSIEDVFTWANTSLLSNLFGVCPGFITDGNSKLVGNARLRQLRVQQDSCKTAGPMKQFVPDCNALYSWEAEDMGSYDPGWNHSVKNNISTSISSPWRYQTQAQLRAYHLWGTLALYRAGGFVAELGPDLQNASSTLEYLFRNKWLDTFTRVIFVEFTVFNANVNLFCIVTLLLETPAIGAFQFSSELHSVRLYNSGDGLHFFVVAAQIIYLLFILYYMFLQGKLMKQQRWAYFRSKWNLLELSIIILSWSAVGVFIKMTLLGKRDLTYYQNHKDQFVSFYETANSNSQLQYMIAFVVLLSTVKLWHLLRLNPNMYMITATLQRAWSDISNFLVIIVVMFLAYSTVSNVVYGWKLTSYKTFEETLLTLVCMQIGIFNYDEVFDDTPLLGGLLFGSCIVFMTFVVLNLLVSVILVAFHHERIYHKPSEEEEIVNLMLKKICSLFGIRYKDTKNSLEPYSSSGLILNNSKNCLNSSIDINIFQTSDNTAKPQEA